MLMDVFFDMVLFLWWKQTIIFPRSMTNFFLGEHMRLFDRELVKEIRKQEKQSTI